MSSPDVFSKKDVLLKMFHIFRRILIQKCDFSRVELTLLHGCSPVNWLNVEHLWVTAFVHMRGSTTDVRLEEGVK